MIIPCTSRVTRIRFKPRFPPNLYQPFLFRAIRILNDRGRKLTLNKPIKKAQKTSDG